METVLANIKKTLFGEKASQNDAFLGLDIGSAAVKVVQFDVSQHKPVLKAAAIAQIADYGDSEQTRVANTRAAIAQCLSEAPFDASYSVCGVCGPETAVREFSFPFLSNSELEGAVRLEAEQVCPFNLDDGTLDYQIIDSNQQKINGAMAAATNKAVKEKQRYASGSLIKVGLMDIDGLALLNCIREIENSRCDATSVVLNIGYSFSTIAIIDEQRFPFVRDIPFGGRGIIDHIAEDTGLSPIAVSRALFTNSQQHTNLLERAARELILNVSETLRFYMTQKKSGNFDTVFVCGGFSLIGDLVELLGQNLIANAMLWNPFNKVDISRADESSCETVKNYGPALAVAAGLALRK
ncbi:MAG: type IV pilus assembly protein PilM [Phycisphaerae bacterium]|nr:type IV pilus assembly protein PilM [Phycisphaerae bacterium]